MKGTQVATPTGIVRIRHPRLMVVLLVALVVAGILVIRAGTSAMLDPVAAADKIKAAANTELAKTGAPQFTELTCNPQQTDGTHFDCLGNDSWGTELRLSAVMSNGHVSVGPITCEMGCSVKPNY